MKDQQILDNATDGATHVDAEKDYFKFLCQNWRSLADIKELVELRKANAELEERLIAPTDSGIDELDDICEKFNGDNKSNLICLVSLVWNKAYFEALKEQGK